LADPFAASIVSTWPHWAHRNVSNSASGPTLGETNTSLISPWLQEQMGARDAVNCSAALSTISYYLITWRDMKLRAFP